MTRLSVAAEAAQQRSGDRLQDDEQDDADSDRHPQGLRRQPRRAILLACAGGPRHHRGRPVRQEVEDRERPGQDDAREAERGELRASEMADDGRVRQDVERLRGERAEGRQRQVEDLPVVR